MWYLTKGYKESWEWKQLKAYSQQLVDEIFAPYREDEVYYKQHIQGFLESHLDFVFKWDLLLEVTDKSPGISQTTQETNDLEVTKVTLAIVKEQPYS